MLLRCLVTVIPLYSVMTCAEHNMQTIPELDHVQLCALADAHSPITQEIKSKHIQCWLSTDSFAGEARPGSRLQPVGRALPAVRTGRNSVAFTTQPALPLSTRAGTTLTRPGAELSRPGADLGRARPALRTGLNQTLPSRAVPATPAPSPAGSPSIAAVYKPSQRSPEVQYRSSRLRPIAATRLR